MDNLDTVRINERIRIRQVLLIDENGVQQGIVETRDAFQRAQTLGLDLVEVAPNSRPPVCKIMDFGKYKYEKKKKQKHVKTARLHEIRLRPQIEEHDFQVKFRKIKEFLEGGDKVQIALKFSGREIVHKELGRDLMDRIVKELGTAAKVERVPLMEGKQMIMILNGV
jgi:translation initiation factor IF-3